jgi:2-keto-4-pentenoate hydratase/2-oxohepta-3-ene-1,7-dioic acid hydratase in catechol pathway
MKLVTYKTGHTPPRLGALLGDPSNVLDLQAAHTDRHGQELSEFATMLDLIRGGDQPLERARDLVSSADDTNPTLVRSINDVSLMAPLPVPEQIRDCLCFEAHLLQAFKILRENKARSQPDPEAALAEYESQGVFSIPDVWYQQPIYYKGNRFSVIGPDDDVIWPSYADLIDYEMEFAMVIGKSGRDIALEDAMGHVFGYTIFNDFTARDAQTVEMPGGLGPAKSKDFDTANAFGPCIVTADEIDPYNLDMVVRINGIERSRGNSATMHWRFEDLIHHISKSETLHPGEIFGSGTVGFGSGLEHESYLSPNDLVELEVQNIGVLRNRLVKQH